MRSHTQVFQNKYPSAHGYYVYSKMDSWNCCGKLLTFEISLLKINLQMFTA